MWTFNCAGVGALTSLMFFKGQLDNFELTFSNFPSIFNPSLELRLGENLIHEHQALNKNVHGIIIFNSKKQNETKCVHAYKLKTTKHNTGRNSNVYFSHSFIFSFAISYLDF